MQFAIDELLLAAKVRDLAVSLRTRDAQKERSRLYKIVDRDLLDDKVAEWVEAHPVSEYVPDALTKIQAVAIQIRESKYESD